MLYKLAAGLVFVLILCAMDRSIRWLAAAYDDDITLKVTKLTKTDILVAERDAVKIPSIVKQMFSRLFWLVDSILKCFPINLDDWEFPS